MQLPSIYSSPLQILQKPKEFSLCVIGGQELLHYLQTPFHAQLLSFLSNRRHQKDLLCDRREKEPKDLPSELELLWIYYVGTEKVRLRIWSQMSLVRKLHPNQYRKCEPALAACCCTVSETASTSCTAKPNEQMNFISTIQKFSLKELLICIFCTKCIAFNQ